MANQKGKIPECEGSDCNKKATVLMRIGSKVNDWMIKTCDECYCYVCDDCANDDGDGTVLCLDCCQTKAIRKMNEEGDGIEWPKEVKVDWPERCDKEEC